ncbi:ATP-dependent Clp protease adaptor ClpS [uncultured Sulfitobacter sp.]|uniref:ATP-dependent Clp protease adaptor ClpS n=1 Tax=uncultured Sulfitobacter sp. TaxID=191468 RepID=UPI0026092489|nr:ATP-dependent Clp protease adaptor ClpS [uncultured Sulfitobacter sp.]
MRRLGIEIENNTTTPMEDVVELHSFVFGRSEREAFEKTCEIHSKGHGLVAIFPEAQLPTIQKRLDLFIEDMNEPVVFQIVQNPSDDASLYVDFDSLQDWDRYQNTKSIPTREASPFLSLVLFPVVALIVIYVFFLQR